MQHQKTHRSGRYRIAEDGTEEYIGPEDEEFDDGDLMDGGMMDNQNGQITFVVSNEHYRQSGSLFCFKNQDGNEVIQDSEGNFIRRVQVNEHGEPLEVHPEGTMVDEHGNHYTHADPAQIEQHHQSHHQDPQQQQQQVGQGGGAGPAKLERIEPDDPYAFDDGDLNGGGDYHLQGPQTGHIMAQPVEQ
jgi:hypothetical protein